MPNPDLLGLPGLTIDGKKTLDRTAALMASALETGDDEIFRRLTHELFLGGTPVHEICDRAVTRAFEILGRHWRHDEIEIYQERRACEIAQRSLHQLRALLRTPPIGNPRAMGVTLEGDPYTLANTMVELTLREAGWNAESFGTEMPLTNFQEAVFHVRPRLAWLSVSAIASEQNFLREYERFFEATRELNLIVVLGGRALHAELRKKMRFSTYCDNFEHLVTFGAAFMPPKAEEKTAKAQ